MNKLITAYSYWKLLSWRKISNYSLLIASYRYSRWIKKPVLWGRPTTLSIEPTTSCNLRCPECPSGLRSFSRPTGMIQEDLFKKIIDDNGQYLTYLHLYFQGEPYLHPKFLDFVSYASQKKVFTATSTNAHYLTEENVEKTLNSGLKQLIVSMDGISQEVYQEYRIGGKLSKVQAGLSLLIHKRAERKSLYPRIILQFLVTGKNEHQLDGLKDWAKMMKVDELQLKTAQIYDFENGSELIPKNIKYSRYILGKNGKWELKKEIENKCWRMWQGSVITWDGRVVPCCFDKDGEHVMGQLTYQRLEDIWQNTKYIDFRTSLLRDRKEIEICKNCTT
ncbi:radical SAM/SPASM domain-containing protein [Belliella kenyensis]|uniref:Radical SAM/SPASM domain-containing protein n=1 Tax=Belliella kenyensis TaxID=1472724 RepID=A0ABV8ERC9_9BACT|nr:radical SAM/SPASM domain-containing protein [Belliella kenyensis]MCH7401634.1 SPASM domain-containing protein [Belliella kenyensis]MDN3603088.1 radical SAM/SPASM domain-containing protein [Belliella kenyensis]